LIRVRPNRRKRISGPFAGIAGTAPTVPGQSTGGLFGGFLNGIFGLGKTGTTTTAVDPWAGLREVPVATGHTGGMGIELSNFRSIHPAFFEHAARFHTGKLPWDPSFEMPAVIRRDEGVFTPGQIAAMSGGGMMISIGTISMPDDADGTDPNGTRRADAIAKALRGQMGGIARSEMVRQKMPNGILSK
jgi:hypothetical protein